MSDPLAQFVFNSALSGSIYLLFSLGLSMTYGLLKFPNIAHGEFFTIGAFTAYFISAGNQPILFEAVGIGSFVSGLVGIISYVFIFRTLVKRGAGMIPLTVASIGWSLVLRYIVSFFYSGIFLYNFTYLGFDFGPLHITTIWVYIIIIALILAILFHILLAHTKFGKAIRATANNASLASASGINTEIVVVFVWFLGSALAGLAGALQGINSGLTSTMGFDIIIIAFSIVILGGIGSFYGSVFSSFLLAFSTNATTLLIFDLNRNPIRLGSFVLNFNINPDYSFIVAFAILGLTLLFLPEGLASIRFTKMRSLVSRRIS